MSVCYQFEEKLTKKSSTYLVFLIALRTGRLLDAIGRWGATFAGRRKDDAFNTTTTYIQRLGPARADKS